MNTKLVEQIANAVLYEGYMLYPYRASAVKNQQRWNFGVIYPRSYAESQTGSDLWSMQTECLLQAGADTALHMRVRFLHLIARTREGQIWQEAMEREVSLPSLAIPEICKRAVHQQFSFPALSGQQPIEGSIQAQAEPVRDGVCRVRIAILNTTCCTELGRDEALMQSFVSTHTILGVEGGEFISLLDPPDQWREAASECKNVGTWPVLVGEEGARDGMLSSPIILYDYPQIAPESPGALFDGTEIDEILTLRIMTLTDEEKAEMGLDERAREILARTESMPAEQFMKLHGVLRGLRPAEQDAR
jgi:hydrogenase maturation protease